MTETELERLKQVAAEAAAVFAAAYAADAAAYTDDAVTVAFTAALSAHSNYVAASVLAYTNKELLK